MFCATMTSQSCRHNYCSIRVLCTYLLFICCWISFLVQTSAIDFEDHDKISNWLNDNDNEFEDDDYDDDDELLPIHVDEFSDGRMTAFFEKLNAMRRKHRIHQRQNSKIGPESFTPFEMAKDYNSPKSNTFPQPLKGNNIALGSKSGILLMQPLIPSSAENDQKEHDPDINDTTTTIGNRDDREDRNVRSEIPRSEEIVSIDGWTREAGSAKSRDRTSHRTVDGYLDMGWYGARCLWRQYVKAQTELELMSRVHERFKCFVRFWTVAIGVSIVFLWSAFGFFNEVFCCGMVAPPATYAKDVNKYLTIMPPHVVVTNKGKMFRYQPTAEERFLWKSAKKIANLKIY